MRVKSLVVTSTPHETRAALLEDGQVVELFFDRHDQRSVAGNMYKGRVRKVLPGMQSAFVDVGLDRDAFLYVGDVLTEQDGAEEDAAPEIEPPTETEQADEAPPSHPPIEDRVEEGQEILVQIAKEPILGKGARVTMNVTLPGRALVYMPTVRHIGVSRRIESTDERARLKGILEARRDAHGDGGFIVRTAAVGADDDALAVEAAALRSQWTHLAERARTAPAPSLIHREAVLLERLMRDLVGADLEEVVVDTTEDLATCRETLLELEPTLVGRVRQADGAESLFEQYGIENEIAKALRSKVWLRSGGYLVINQTEALVAIDINTGRFVGSVSLEDTARRTNLEAVAEIVRQVRLRDLGGILVVDFIDMDEPAHREQLMTALEDELKRDRSRTKILKVSDFGLVEMTRKRVRGSLERLLSQPCPGCGGSGRVKSALTTSLEIYRAVLRGRGRMDRAATIELRVHPDVAAVLDDPERGFLDGLARATERRVVVLPDDALHVERYQIEARV